MFSLPCGTGMCTFTLKIWYEGVLILAGIELIFFIVASMGLYFGFLMKTVCSTYCLVIAEQRLTNIKVSSIFHVGPPSD